MGKFNEQDHMDYQGSISVNEETLNELKIEYFNAIEMKNNDFYYKDILLDIKYASKLISAMENIIHFNDFNN